ncbi:hypothetical protein BTVI_67696 [Pitangus sulphuratus]|nr:hypothetical protein BTVI_67696 [Pitangus sulphuratus]
MNGLMKQIASSEIIPLQIERRNPSMLMLHSSSCQGDWGFPASGLGNRLCVSNEVWLFEGNLPGAHSRMIFVHCQGLNIRIEPFLVCKVSQLLAGEGTVPETKASPSPISQSWHILQFGGTGHVMPFSAATVIYTIGGFPE